MGFGGSSEYAATGHSGDAPQIPFVDFGSPPVDRKAHLAVHQKMAAHSQFYWSAEAAVRTVREENNSGNNNNNNSGEGYSLGDGGDESDGGLEGADAAAKRHFVFFAFRRQPEALSPGPG